SNPEPDLNWIDELLHGIDHEETEHEHGWWETSTGAAFGKSILTELKQQITARYHTTPADHTHQPEPATTHKSAPPPPTVRPWAATPFDDPQPKPPSQTAP
ncbi:hypothetical protein NDR86_30830, partial [Nocardia sp. CDC141]|nr:hypothetical protein [Nocardia pulmonis]